MPKDNNKYRVIILPTAQTQLDAIYDYIADAAAPDIAERYVNALIKHVEKLDLFPLRGTRRDDLIPGLRMTHYKKRIRIAFIVDKEARLVSIIHVFYGGQNYESIIKNSINCKA